MSFEEKRAMIEWYMLGYEYIADEIWTKLQWLAEKDGVGNFVREVDDYKYLIVDNLIRDVIEEVPYV